MAMSRLDECGHCCCYGSLAQRRWMDGWEDTLGELDIDIAHLIRFGVS